MENEIDDAEQLEQIRRDKAENLRQVQMNDLREMLTLPAGIRFLKRIWNNSQVYSDAHTGNSTTYYNLGFKRFGLNLASDLRELWKVASPQERETIAAIMIEPSSDVEEPKGERQ